MSDESTQVLRMLAEGKISVEDANRLLEALGETGQEWSTTPAPASPIQQGSSRKPQPAKDAPRFTVSQIVQMSDHGIDPDYLVRLRKAGLSDLGFEDLIRLSDHGVEVEYVLALREAGLRELGVEDVIRLHDHGVEADTLQELAQAGITDLSVDDLVEMADHGVDPEFIIAARVAGVRV